MTTPTADTALKPSSTGWCYALIVVAVLASYHAALRAVFVLDDIPCIAENAALESFELFGPMVPTGMARRPVGHFTLALNYWIGGRRPLGYHAANVAIH